MSKIILNMPTTIFLKFFIHIINFVFNFQRNTLHLINQGKIGAHQELSNLVKLSVNFTSYLSVILLMYINKIMLYTEIDLIESSESLNENTTLIFSMIAT